MHFFFSSLACVTGSIWEFESQDSGSIPGRALLARCPPSHHLKLGPAVRCRSPPEFPFRFIWVLGWSTWYLCANDPTPCTCKTNYLRILMLFNIFRHDAKFKPAATHALTQPRASAEGARSVLPMRWGRSDSCLSSPTARRHLAKPTRK